MFRAMGTWLYGGDPLTPLTFEAPLAALKARARRGERVFETLIEAHLTSTTSHRTTVLLKADTGKAAAEAAEERARLDAAQQGLDAAGAGGSGRADAAPQGAAG